MARQPDKRSARDRAPSRLPAATAGKGGRAARTLAQGTLLAAGIAVAQFNPPEVDSRYHLFNPELVDRLRAPITRYHE
jgi:hypothetical protein